MLTYMHLMSPCTDCCFVVLILVFHCFTTRLSFWFVLFKWKIFEAVPCRHNKNHSGERAFLFMWLKNVCFEERNKRYIVANIYAILQGIKSMKCVFASCFLKYFMENTFVKRQKSISPATHLIVALERLYNPFIYRSRISHITKIRMRAKLENP